ncbi:MAG: ATP-dependent Clp protease ATP-binding subunit ClpC, partial [Peptococcaceae bacterium]|nr:ATP-dependent Clp protease ATP-binding subunit ClpC [Peptococcaceae bacterium]
MFGHFTEKAQRVMYYAQEEARAMHYPAVGTEHLLMGLLREEDSVAARALLERGVTLDKVHELISQVVTPGNMMIGNEIGITPRVKKVLQFAQEEAVRWGVNYIGTEHLLLGLLREGEGLAAQVLQALDVEPDSVRKQVKALLGGTGTMDANIAGGQKGVSG